MTAVRHWTIFPNRAFIYALMVPTLPQILIEQLDTLPICRHIEHMHKGVWFRKNNF